ncbi:disease resistance protein RPM1-like protein [Cinnamomum micranthum f. kanehirae]|uniref:Disease resistance protein RPM1-like protein n=1 Tax=Cinnamomum micranthum f. kanehirae TaxID=337451 RepID=A0A443P2F2_9MAGN|nr:disease resistance protein RPM1-like protein [Cinnamomum micranthum f. kanehirae]
MAETAVGFLLKTLGSLVQQEASLLQGLPNNLNEIKLDLDSMRSFLKDSDRRSSSEDGVRTWVGQVREVTYKVEDMIDMYMYYVAEQHRGEGFIRRGLRKIVLRPNRYWYKHEIASELLAIKSEIRSISERSKQYKFIEEGSTSKMTVDGENWQRSRDYLRFISDEDIVGITQSKDFLINRLTEVRPERVVLSVVGMGGLGKTTLVTKVCNSSQVKDHFDCCAWITVSQTYKVDELLRSMIKELHKSNEEVVPDGISNMSIGDLIESVIKCLENKRYVVVLDDVWDAIVWKDIQVAFPNNGCGGRVIITTRKDDVSSFFGDKNVLRLEPLGNEDALVLFCKKAFSNESCPLELKPHAERLVQKCEGLPLAITAIGGLMSKKEKSSLEWKKVEDNLSWQLSSKVSELERMKNILLLSYGDMPYNLKCCFLYCSLFPEDYAIPRKRLIRLWVAEGFIEECGEYTLEEVAAEYINDLICRSMLQAVEDIFKVRKLVRMHDVLRELALSIGREEKFCNVHVAKEDIQSNEARRLSLYNCTGSIQSSTCHLRSLMLFPSEIPSLSFKSIASSIKLLRVLDLQGSSINSVPDVIVELFNIRYLSLRDTNVEKLPKSIGRLWNLQTLDIRGSKIKRLPKGVEKLKKLRHLFSYRFRRGDFDFYDFAQAPTGICNLKCLQTLQCIGANDEVVENVGKLTQLRKLTIRDVQSFHGGKLSASLQKLKSLLMLQVKATSGEEMLRLDTMLHPPTHLENLQLSGRLERLPPWIRSLEDLKRVSLHWSQLNEDPFTLLQGLRNLVLIELTNAYVGNELCIRRGSFLKLKSLSFIKLPRLDRICIEEESMSCIERITVFKCPELKSAPEGIQYLTSLQVLYLRDMPGEFLMKIRQDRGVNLQHIPKIIHYNSIERAHESF